MPSTLPDGEPAPTTGQLPDPALREVGSASFSAYVHVPFCATRCGYCDFNTYTADELGGTSQSQYVAAVVSEITLAQGVVPGLPPLSSIFFGGGTPTLLAPGDQALMVRTLIEAFDVMPGCEITTEANPESVSPAQLDQLRAAGVNRISFGMQSAAEHVLRTLDRTHTSGAVTNAIAGARSAGFESISVDLIYGTPGESRDDWQRTLDAALALEPDHVSAYSLIVEPGTALARRIDRGEIADTDADDQAEKYEAAERSLTAEGLQWYEVSNWARSASDRCQHNLVYWRGQHWWGFGPGAHSHVGGVRWWNVKHPRAYAERMAADQSPAQAREVLTPSQRTLERILLETRVSDGLDMEVLSQHGRQEASAMVSEGLVNSDDFSRGVVSLTLSGRLLADLVVRRLSADTESDGE